MKALNTTKSAKKIQNQSRGSIRPHRLLLDRYQAGGNADLLDWADALAADVVKRAIITPQGITWSNTEHTRTPPELPPEPGLMQGAAGIAGWLARLHALHTDRHTPAAPLGMVPSWL